MAANDSHGPEQQKRAQAGAPKLKLVEWHGITVARYASGECRSWHNRMDMGTRRTYSVSLPVPTLDAVNRPWHINALAVALGDMMVDAMEEERLF